MGVPVSARGGSLAALVCACLLALPCPAWAQSTSDDLARRHFESGVAYLEESDYENAQKAFEKSYELSKRPEILLNIATVHERKAELAAAVEALKQYLSAAPQGEHVDTVKLRIQNLEKRIADAQDSKPGNVGKPEGGAAPAPVPPPAAPLPAPIQPSEAPPSSAHSRHLPAFIALGIGGVAAGGAVLTGILAKVSYDDKKSSCSPHCSDSDLSGTRTLAVTSTILTGVAIVGVGVGVTLYLMSPRDQERASLKPRLELGLLPGAGAARALWRF